MDCTIGWCFQNNMNPWLLPALAICLSQQWSVDCRNPYGSGIIWSNRGPTAVSYPSPSDCFGLLRHVAQVHQAVLLESGEVQMLPLPKPAQHHHDPNRPQKAKKCDARPLGSLQPRASARTARRPGQLPKIKARVPKHFNVKISFQFISCIVCMRA